MQQCKTSAEDTGKRVSVRTGGAGHAHSGVANGATSNGCATVLRSPGNIIVRLGT
jgi:hypothetical protein